MRFGIFLGLALGLLGFAACGGDDEEPKGTVGLTCATNLDCGPVDTAVCAKGYIELAGDDTPDDDTDVHGGVGLMFPAGVGYCMPRARCPAGSDCAPDQVAGCQADSDCPSGAACYRPLAGASADGLPFSAADLDAGHCLVPCTDGSECRTDEGLVCAVPLARELAGVEGASQATFCIPPAVEPACAPDPARNLAGTCTLTYDVEGSFQITGTPLNMGDGTFTMGPGTLVVRVPSADGVAPGDGAASVLCYEMKQRFEVAGVITSVHAYAASSGSEALNSGALAGDTITWDECTYGSTYCESVSSWIPDDAAAGPGCVTAYHSEGDVNCTLNKACSLGNLDAGHNPQDDVWDQPFNSLVFGEGFDTVTMSGLGGLDTCALPDQVADKVEIPNRSPSRTWLAFTGNLRTMECTPL